MKMGIKSFIQWNVYIFHINRYIFYTYICIYKTRRRIKDFIPIIHKYV